MTPIFITGIGTGVGKTIASAIVCKALQTAYWKPIQAGFDDGTDKQTVINLTNNSITQYAEVYKLAMAASPHIAAKQEGLEISIGKIVDAYTTIAQHNQHEFLVVEGAGGLLVPVNNNQFIIDIIKALQAKVIIVSQNYLGSINHSLLTAQICKQHNIHVLGWLFNQQYLNYEEEIVQWSGYPKICSLPFADVLSANWINEQAQICAPALLKVLR